MFASLGSGAIVDRPIPPARLPSRSSSSSSTSSTDLMMTEEEKDAAKQKDKEAIELLKQIFPEADEEELEKMHIDIVEGGAKRKREEANASAKPAIRKNFAPEDDPIHLLPEVPIHIQDAIRALPNEQQSGALCHYLNGLIAGLGPLQQECVAKEQDFRRKFNLLRRYVIMNERQQNLGQG